MCKGAGSARSSSPWRESGYRPSKPWRIRSRYRKSDFRSAAVSQSSNSPSIFERAAFCEINSSYGKRRLRITINHPHEAVGRRVVGVPVKFLHVLAMIALRPGQAEEAFFQKRIAPIPKSEGKTEPLLVIGNSADAILVPAIGAGASMIVGKIIPGIAVRAVILPHRAPCAFTQVRP